MSTSQVWNQTHHPPCVRHRTTHRTTVIPSILLQKKGIVNAPTPSDPPPPSKPLHSTECLKLIILGRNTYFFVAVESLQDSDKLR